MPSAALTALVGLVLSQDSDGPPLYRQLYDQLRGLILNGRLPPGTRLPATRSLALELGLARNTITAAYEQLLAEGYLVGRQGSGTYVSSELPDPTPDGASVDEASEPVSATASPGLSRRGQVLAGIRRLPARKPRPLTSGTPAMELFPFDVWNRLMARCWRHPAPELLFAGEPGGYGPLREAIASYLRTVRALRCDADQVIIVNGAQQGINLTAQVLLDPGDAAWVEEPGYAGLRGALTSAGVRAVSVPVDKDGLDVEAGREREPKARIACVAPSHQHPLGVVMSLPRRLQLIEWADQQDAWILEDDYDSEYRYAGRPLAALQGLDRTDRVIYVGSFSKVLFPSLRLGYLVVPPSLVDGFRRARQVLDDHASLLAQPALALFIEEGHFASHIRRTRRLYAERQEALLAAAESHLGDLLMLAPDEAGMHLIAELGPGLDRSLTDRDIVAIADKQASVSLLPLSAFYTGPAERQGLVMGYAGYDEAAIDGAIARLATVLKRKGAGND